MRVIDDAEAGRVIQFLDPQARRQLAQVPDLAENLDNLVAV